MIGYNSFAWFYDRLTNNVEYNKIAEAVDRYVDRFGGRKKSILLDLACGTGNLSERMSERGYDVIGVDSSDMMLNIALDKKYDNGSDIQYLKQDMTELDMFGTIDVTVCVLDSINHLCDENSVKKTFERVSLFAFPDGMFIFDVNTHYKHSEVLAQNAYTYRYDDLYCAWQNQYNGDDNSVDIYLDFFEKNESGTYDRYSECFTEYFYDDKTIKRLLKETGFELCASYDGYTDHLPTNKSQRIVYVAKKIDKR